MWMLFVILYLICHITFTQVYKIVIKKSENDGALTAMLQIIAGIISLIFMPFFKFTFPSSWYIYALLGLACIFYALSDRMNTTVRAGIEASTFSILVQLATVFMIVAGLLFFKEPFVLKKIIGAIIIIFSNILMFYEKGHQKLNKYVILGIISNLAYAIAVFLDVNISDSFNLAFYVALTLIIPAIFIIIGERIKPSIIKKEFMTCDKLPIFITSISWTGLIIFQLLAYLYGEVTTVSPLLALTVIGNVIIGYIFLKERNNLPKKIVAAILIIISVILIKG